MRIVRLEDLNRLFPIAAPLPPLLATFLEWRNAWQERNPTGDLRQHLSFDLCDDTQALTLWYGGPAEYTKQALSSLAVFAQDADGSLLAFWFRDAEPGKPVGTAPIVLLHAEGIPDSHVVAPSLGAFLQLTAGTDTEIARLSSREQSNQQSAVLMEFRHWLSAVAGIPPLRTEREAALIEKGAQASEEAFQAWIHA
jgi:hypothetical protein